MDFTAHLFVFFGWLMGGITGGAAGMGAGMIALPVMALYLDVKDVVVSTTAIGTFSTIHLFLSYRRFSHLDDIRDLLFSALPCCIAGTFLLRIVPRPFILASIAALLLAFIFLKLCGRAEHLHLSESKPAKYLAGAVIGLCQGGNSMSGPPLAIYVLLKKWDPDRARGNMSVVFLLMCLITVAALIFNGLFAWHLMGFAFSGIAGILIGQPLGVLLGRNIDRRIFERILLILLILAAISLIAKAFFD